MDIAMRTRQALCFDDVLLKPQYSSIESRSEIDLSTSLKYINESISVPIISSPMDTVTSSCMVTEMYSAGGLGIVHRYNTVHDQAELVSKSVRLNPNVIVGAAIGVSGDYIDRAIALKKAGASIICIDIAHGHHVLMRHAIETLRKTFGTTLHIMAGNVATLEGFNDLADWGADSIRVGVGGGSCCSTRGVTGHGVPTLQSIMDCAMTDRDAAIIADGGIRNSGDIVKAYGAGADMVILGSLLAGTDSSPGAKVYKDGKMFKTYRGMASAEAQIDWRGHTASLEGISSMVPIKGTVSSVIESLTAGIRSGLSYSGARTMPEFHAKACLVEVSNSSLSESRTHINNK